MRDGEDNIVEMNPAGTAEESVNPENSENSAMRKLSDDIAQADIRLDELNSEDRNSEDIIYQENEFLKSRMEARYQNDERERKELLEKQKMLEERLLEQTSGLAKSRQMQLYNRMHEDEQRDMVYSLHGISADKEQGMKEYKNALYQGSQIILFFADLILCAVTAFSKGMASAELMACVALLASQATLLPREHDGRLGRTPYSVLSMILSFLPAPAMAFVLISEQFGIVDTQTVLAAAAGGSVLLCFIGALDYFVRNPYRSSRAAVREAKADLKDLKRSAARTVRKNQKLRAKLISRLTREKERKEQRLVRLKEREEQKYIRARERQEQKARRLEAKLAKQSEMREKYSEVSALASENRKKRKELMDRKIVDIKSKVDSVFNKKAN